MPDQMDPIARAQRHEQLCLSFNKFIWLLSTFVLFAMVSWSYFVPVKIGDFKSVAFKEHDIQIRTQTAKPILMEELRFQETMVVGCLRKAPSETLPVIIHEIMSMHTRCDSPHSAIAEALRNLDLMPVMNQDSHYVIDHTITDTTKCVDLFNKHKPYVLTLDDLEKQFKLEMEEEMKVEQATMTTPLTYILRYLVVLIFLITMQSSTRMYTIKLQEQMS
ncbi:hypothetical protein T484DRAFT_1860723 [Baffinella frigidus]|nr:hypothetical protein T484DRAFT_1860723 [Cryptophyta sp. CCMP2293]